MDDISSGEYKRINWRLIWKDKGQKKMRCFVSNVSFPTWLSIAFLNSSINCFFLLLWLVSPMLSKLDVFRPVRCLKVEFYFLCGLKWWGNIKSLFFRYKPWRNFGKHLPVRQNVKRLPQDSVLSKKLHKLDALKKI